MFRYRGRNKDPPQDATDQPAIDTVRFPERIGDKEGQGESVNQQNHCDSF